MSNPLKIAPAAGTPDTTPHSGAESSRHKRSPALAILIGLLAWAIASQPVASMTLQTCYGPNNEYRLLVRLVAA